MSLKINLKKFDPRNIEKRRIDPSKGPPTIVVIGKRGTGKCHGKDTQIVMYDGTIKKVQDIKKGDLVMGDDSTSRKVLGITQGKSEMYKIKQNNGEDYIINEHHILSLKVVATNSKNGPINIQGKKYYRGDIIDIPIKDYLKLSKIIRQDKLKGYKVPIHFEEKKLLFDPYLLGIWLGDGHSLIVKYLKETFPNYNCHLKQLNLIDNKHIPHMFLCNSKQNRLKLLAGLLDADACLYTCNNYEITQKNYTLSKNIEFLVRSLGFLCKIKKTKKVCTTKNEKFESECFRICISGNGIEEIPCLIPRKIVRPRNHIKDNLVTGIKVENIGVDDYYGFELDKNHRFLLGDTTVSHNSFLVADLLYYVRKIPTGVIMSGTEAGIEFFGKIFPESFIYEDYQPDQVSKIIDIQKKITGNSKNKDKDNSTLLLLEDCMYDKKALKSKDVRGIFMNGRHWRILFMLTMQYCMDILPELRTNIDYVFVLREQTVNIRKKLYDNFFGILPSFDIFQQVMNEVTDDYGCLVIDNTSQSNNIEDCLFWYKAKFPQRQNLRIGGKDMWRYHYKNYTDKKKDDETNLQEYKSKHNVEIHKLKKKKKKR